MARIEDPRESKADQQNQTERSAPEITVLGKMDGHYAVRCHWTAGVHQVSPARLKFLNELGIIVNDNADNYVL